LLQTMIDIDASENDDYQANGDVEGAHHLSNSLPMLTKQITPVSQTQTPGEGAKEGIDCKPNKGHLGYASREADKGAHYREKA